jgi:5-hydroxyisourate hydrolase
MSEGHLTTHVLDTARGCGAAGMVVEVHRGDTELASITLDEGGRGILLAKITKGNYELLFHAGDYQGTGFFDIIPIRFGVTDPAQKYHIPLILSPFGYSTYRGG